MVFSGFYLLPAVICLAPMSADLLINGSVAVGWLIKLCVRSIGQQFFFFHARMSKLVMNIYVGNLSYDLAEEELRQLFEEFGSISSCTIIKDGYTGKSKGFGFVEMDDDAQADSAIEALNGKSVKGRMLRVNQARPRTERPRSSVAAGE